MSRLQLAINVANLEESIEFYSRLFGAAPNKVKPGYANFAIQDPPLKLVLFEGDDDPGTINHLGVECEDASQVVAAQARLAGEGLAPSEVDESTCCYAEKVETWITDPNGPQWEWYVKTDDSELAGESKVNDTTVCCPSSGGCC